MLGNFTAEVVDHNPVIRAAVREAFTAWADAIADVLTQARTEGSLRAGVDTRSAARFVINAWEGALLESRAYQCTDAFDNFFTVVFGVLLPSEEPPTSTD
jgi:TetR/AcrR family transcriptional repressor of nem operon